MRRLLRQIVRSNDQNLVIHPCSLVFPNGEDHVGYTNPVHVKQALRCKEDFDLLYTCRAFSKSILTSGKNVRLENDWNPSLNVKVPEGFEYPFSFYSQLRHQESLRLNLPESLSTCILTNGEIPSRVLELPNNIQETITTYKAENVFRALNHLFSTKQGPGEKDKRAVSEISNRFLSISMFRSRTKHMDRAIQRTAANIASEF